MATNAIGRRLSSIEAKASMRSSDIANVLNVRPETVSRWNQGKAFPHPATEKQILELDFIVDQLSDFFSPDEARLWLFSRQKLLGGRVPAEIIQSGNIDDVLGAVNQIREGVFL